MKLFKLIASRAGQVLFDDRVEADSPREAREQMKALMGLNSLTGVVYAITEIPVELIQSIVDARLVEALQRLRGGQAPAKTSVVELVALQLAGTHLSIEDYNGREVTVDIVRDWMRQLAYGSLFSSWSVKIVNELDRCSREAQDLLLTYPNTSATPPSTSKRRSKRLGSKTPCCSSTKPTACFPSAYQPANHAPPPSTRTATA